MSKIMIVEDDPMLIEIYEKKLKDVGFDVKVVSSGLAVKDEMLAWRPEFVLLDIVLPDMDGFEILKTVKKEPEIKNIPIYVFSNLSSKEDIDRTTALGAAGFLTKSGFTPTQLAEELKKIMSKDFGALETAAAPQIQAPPETQIEKKKPTARKF
jgi:CheY-like chemotaxis protein